MKSKPPTILQKVSRRRFFLPLSPSASLTREPRCQSQQAKLCPLRFPLLLRLQSSRSRRNSLLPPLYRTWKCDHGAGVFSGCGGALLSRKCVATAPPPHPAVTVSISTSPAWIPSEPDLVTRPLVPAPDSCPRAAVRPPGYTLTCELSLRLQGLGYQLQRRTNTRKKSFPFNTSQSLRGAGDVGGEWFLESSWHRPHSKSVIRCVQSYYPWIVAGGAHFSFHGFKGKKGHERSLHAKPLNQLGAGHLGQHVFILRKEH